MIYNLKYKVRGGPTTFKIYVNYHPTCLAKIFGIKPKHRTFVGGVDLQWYELPSCRTCGEWEFKWLNGVLKKLIL